MLFCGLLLLTVTSWCLGYPVPTSSKEGTWLIDIDEDLAKMLTEAEVPFALTIRSFLKLYEPNQELSVPLEDIFFVADEETSVRLSKLTLTNLPQIKVNEILPDLSLLTLYMDFTLDILRISGDCGEYDRGNITVSLSDVSVTGVFGLNFQENNFQSYSGDLIYTPRQISVQVFYRGNDGKLIDESFTSDVVEGSLVQPFYNDLTIQLNHLVREQINVILRNIPVNSFMNDKTIRLFTEYSNKFLTSVNSVAGFLVDVIRKDIIKTSQDEILFPGFTHNYTKQIDDKVFSGEFVAENGWFKGLSNLEQADNVIVTRQSAAFTVFCELELSTMELGYANYITKTHETSSTGQIIGTGGRNSFTLKVTFNLANEKCGTILNELRFDHFKNFKIEATNLNSFSWLTPQVNSWVIGQFKGKMLHEIQNRLAKSVRTALDLFHCGIQ